MHTCNACGRKIDFNGRNAVPVHGSGGYVHIAAFACSAAQQRYVYIDDSSRISRDPKAAACRIEMGQTLAGDIKRRVYGFWT